MDEKHVSSLPPSLTQGRLLIVGAALLWSLSGAFVKVLTRETAFHLNSPSVPSEQMALPMAFYRGLFAGLILVPTLRVRDLSYRPLMLVMMGCFAAMNALFVSAMAQGSAANAILLQYTAPMWMYLASIWWLGEPADRRNSVALIIGLLGIAVIVIGGWENEQLLVVGIALGSGFAYAGVVLCLRALRTASPRWLTVINHLGSALVLIPFMMLLRPYQPTPAQLAVLFLFGTVQMALPYWLMARGLQTVSPQEAGAITLLEPLLNPLWAYLVAGEEPSRFTFLGGALILGGLLWRYWPQTGAPKTV